MAADTDVEARYSALGGVFLTPAHEIAGRLAGLQGLLFDWDGVFNDGAKGEGVASSFSEADSMGVNLLRFALWRARGELPYCGLISGEDNPTARRFARREHLHVAYGGVKDKAAAVDDFCATLGSDARRLLCVFDDVNDLAMARRCGLRVLIRRDASPLLEDYVVRHGLCDYVTGARSGQHAVREVTELALGLLGAFDDVVAARIAYDGEYARYFAARQGVETRFVAPAVTEAGTRAAQRSVTP